MTEGRAIPTPPVGYTWAALSAPLPTVGCGTCDGLPGNPGCSTCGGTGRWPRPGAGEGCPWREQHYLMESCSCGSHETREARAAMRDPWIVQPDDVIGGTCITLAIPRTPAQGNPPIANFLSPEVAQHIVNLHNAHVAAREIGSRDPA